MANTHVKICGITRSEDAALAGELGADMIGLNFVGGPRKISRELGGVLYNQVHSHSPASQVVALVNLDTEPTGTPGTADGPFCYPANHFQVYSSDYGRHRSALRQGHFWMVAAIKHREDIAQLHVTLAAAALSPAMLILDTAHDSKLGGTGQSFNWHWIAEARDAGELDELPPIILAGGLTPENVADAIRIARPYAVDVSSGVEVAGKPGVKDPIKMRDFIQAAKG